MDSDRLMFWVVTGEEQLLKPVSALIDVLGNQHTPMGSDLKVSLSLSLSLYIYIYIFNPR
jgi:hypothetical protein